MGAFTAYEFAIGLAIGKIVIGAALASRLFRALALAAAAGDWFMSTSSRASRACSGLASDFASMRWRIPSSATGWRSARLRSRCSVLPSGKVDPPDGVRLNVDCGLRQFGPPAW